MHIEIWTNETFTTFCSLVEILRELESCSSRRWHGFKIVHLFFGHLQGLLSQFKCSQVIVIQRVQYIVQLVKIWRVLMISVAIFDHVVKLKLTFLLFRLWIEQSRKTIPRRFAIIIAVQNTIAQSYHKYWLMKDNPTYAKKCRLST